MQNGLCAEHQRHNILMNHTMLGCSYRDAEFKFNFTLNINKDNSICGCQFMPIKHNIMSST